MAHRGFAALRGLAQALEGPTFRSGAMVAAMGFVSCLPFYLVIYGLQAQGQSAAATAMGSMHMQQMGVFWAFPVLQAAGIGALIWAYVGLVLGLVVAGRPPRWWRLSRPQTDRLHRQVSLLVIALIVVHALATAEDAMGDNLRTAFLPWQESWTAAVFAYNIGIFALYLAVLVGPTYYLRRRIGTRFWMVAHRSALVIYVLSVWHTLLLGADFSHYTWVRTVTWLAQIPLFGLLAYRLLKSRRRGPAAVGSRRYWWAPARYWLAGVSIAAAVAVVVVVATGYGDLPERVGSAVAAPVVGADWLPAGLGITLAVLLALTAVFHVRHLVAGPGGRTWHATHVLMAAGMIDMLLPVRSMPVPGSAGKLIFGAAALAALAAGAVRWRAGRAGAVLALVAGADLAIMAFMFAAPRGASTWLTYLLCAWLTLETAYWASGRLGTLAGHGPARQDRPVSPPGSPAGPAEPVTPAPAAPGTPGASRAGAALAPAGDATAGQDTAVTTLPRPAEPVTAAEEQVTAAAEQVIAEAEQAEQGERSASAAGRARAAEPATAAGGRYRAELAVSLALTCLVMAYMLVAAHYGSGVLGHGMGGMPGMPQ